MVSREISSGIHARNRRSEKSGEESTGRVRPSVRCFSTCCHRSESRIRGQRQEEYLSRIMAKVRGVARSNKSAIENSASPENSSSPLPHTHKRAFESFTMLPSSGTERKAVPSRFYGSARPNFHPITDLANRPARISVRQLGSARDDPNRCPNRRAIYNTRVTEIDNTRNSCFPPLFAVILRFVSLILRGVRIRETFFVNSPRAN